MSTNTCAITKWEKLSDVKAQEIVIYGHFKVKGNKGKRVHFNEMVKIFNDRCYLSQK